MFAGARVFAGVLIGRAVATKRHAALLARAQVHPLSTDLHALGAFAPVGGLNRTNRLEMRAASADINRLTLAALDERRQPRSIPSPTAEATRLTFPARTSLTAEYAGQTRFKEMRWTPQGQPAWLGLRGTSSVPVLMKPLASSSTQPPSQLVLGTAPVMTKDVANIVGFGFTRSIVAPAHRARDDRFPSTPRFRCTSPDRQPDSLQSVELNNATCSPLNSPRTSMWTHLDVCARNVAAWPAEFPPPTTTTSSSRHNCAPRQTLRRSKCPRLRIVRRCRATADDKPRRWR